ncbi:spore germination protein [Rossellomorea sp. DA94]|uniref:spore germination protein n=1 Tax=Rossellomorea sp. DA94 TaxID=3038653 RepID=UPI00244B2CC5|nr:spore germination protein [Rossellomorea sp. DA94]WGG46606.1 spore germination protein [Rossellomorea sp. DA94]
MFKEDMIDKSITRHKTYEELIESAKKSKDFVESKRELNTCDITIQYFTTLIDHDTMQRSLLTPLSNIEPNMEIKTLHDIKVCIPIEGIAITDEVNEIEDKLYNGFVVLSLGNVNSEYMLLNMSNSQAGLRQFNESENEFSVIGPKMGFVESLDINMYLLRRKIKSPALVIEELSMGSMSKTKVIIAYLDGITSDKHINSMRQRLSDVDFDIVWDTTALEQIISDQSNSPFPLFLSTERIDRVAYALVSGQVAVMSDGSPYVMSGPSTLLDFFISPEDYYYNWVLGSFFRLVRLMGVFFSIFSSSLYVSVMTYHYEVIPMELLEPLLESRANVPFPPFIEVIFLEITIELLREAGARLPTKVGQTLGIVGGIVIGQAAVSAALTSNVLLIIVALSALASFTTPIVTMSNTIRLLRFPFILLASFLGGLGIMIGFVCLLCHLFNLKSLGTPYVVPLYPFRKESFADSFIRLPFRMINKRPLYLDPKQRLKFNPGKEKRGRGELTDE